MKEQVLLFKAQAEQLVAQGSERLTMLEMRIDTVGKNQVILHNMLAELLRRIPEPEGDKQDTPALTHDEDSSDAGRIN
jgi:chaperonin cofactor prefoldin